MLDVAPCEGRSELFDSVFWGDHQGARRFCVDPKTDEPRCQFYAACLRMTAAERAGELGAHCVEGTRAGSLYIDGKLVTKPRARDIVQHEAILRWTARNQAARDEYAGVQE
jgi:hypothetical protein